MNGPEDGQESRWFIFAASKLLVTEEGGSLTVPLLKAPAAMDLHITRQQRIGTIDGVDCYAGEAADGHAPPAGWQFRGLRSIYGRLPETLFRTAILAVHMLEWDRGNRFCGACGAPLAMRSDVRAKECTACGRLVFPRISPAIIVAIERGARLLLARSARFAEELYSVLAGFVEPGETLEEAVYREVKEEVGITVKNIRYFGSQPWPFPDSLMVGFTAEYDAGEIAIDGEEIVAARWFAADQLPSIPGPISIARRLIDAFIEKQRNKR
jgi:NAD+ diphosphatase